MTKVITNNQRWHILGAGAIGQLWSAYWQQQGINTPLITRRNPSKNAVCKQLINSHSSFSYQYHTRLAESVSETITQLLICTKAQDTFTAFNSIKHQLSDDAVIIFLQNGLQDTRITPQNTQQVFAAITTDGANFDDNGSLIHVGPGTTHIGRINNDDRSKNADQALLGKLPQELDIQLCNDIKQRQWQKLAINCAINALTVKYNCQNGQLLTIDQAREELKKLCREIELILEAMNVNVPKNIYLSAIKVAEITADNISSTLQDIRAGRSTEIEAFNGFLYREANKCGIDNPINTALYNYVKTKERENN